MSIMKNRNILRPLSGYAGQVLKPMKIGPFDNSSCDSTAAVAQNFSVNFNQDFTNHIIIIFTLTQNIHITRFTF